MKSQTRLSDFTCNFHFPLECIGEGNGNPLQCSCLENPRDGGAWWAAVYGVAQSRTRRKRLSSSSSSGSVNNESACNAGDLGSIPGLGRFPGGRHGNPLQYSCLENPHGQRSLAGCSPWGRKELDTTEQLSTHMLIMKRQLQDKADPFLLSAL